jgi:hypothetical protein
MPSTNQKARAEHLGRASQPPPVHPRLEVGGAELRAIQRAPAVEVAGFCERSPNVPIGWKSGAYKVAQPTRMLILVDATGLNTPWRPDRYARGSPSTSYRRAGRTLLGSRRPRRAPACRRAPPVEPPECRPRAWQDERFARSSRLGAPRAWRCKCRGISRKSKRRKSTAPSAANRLSSWAASRRGSRRRLVRRRNRPSCCQAW